MPTSFIAELERELRLPNVREAFLVESVPRWVFDKVLTLLIAMVFSRLLWWGPLISQAGAMANLLEWHLTGHVLDWIIFPDGAFGVRALSLGDIAIYGGVALTVSALASR